MQQYLDKNFSKLQEIVKDGDVRVLQSVESHRVGHDLATTGIH